jgi:midasin
LAEKGGDVVEEIVAHPDFRIFATMNPGGDFGKKELSPALRNRFTEIWVPEITDEEDLLTIITDQMAQYGSHVVSTFAQPVLSFVTWFNNADFANKGGSNQKNKNNTKKKKNTGKTAERTAFFMTLRDVLSWITFIGTTMNGDGNGDGNGDRPVLAPWVAYVHGCALVMLDGLGLGAGLSERATTTVRFLFFFFF